MSKLRGFVYITLLSLAPSLVGETRLTTSEAGQHIGETATVCGVVASARYAERTRGDLVSLEKSQQVILIDEPDLRSPFVRWKNSRFNPASDGSRRHAATFCHIVDTEQVSFGQGGQSLSEYPKFSIT